VRNSFLLICMIKAKWKKYCVSDNPTDPNFGAYPKYFGLFLNKHCKSLDEFPI
jgi:hypothetical protein